MKLLRLFIALLGVLVIRLLKGRVRIGMLWTDRIGHLAGNVEVYLCERDAGLRPRSFDIWCASGVPCNEQLLRMWQRVLHIDRTWFSEIVLKVNRFFKGWEKFEIPSGNLDRDVNNLLDKYQPHLSFTPDDEVRGELGLRNMGIPKGAKWVCLMVRDSAYLPHLDYHSYRDSDIDTYMEAAKALADRGYYVIRMGAKVNKPLKVNHPKVIDYATNGMRSEFMDIYLSAKCELAISTSTGIDAVCTVFRRPICYVNFAPLEYLPTWNPRALAIWKHCEKDGKRMTLAEIYESGAGQFMRTHEYEQAGIKLIDNTPEEIKAVVEEMADAVENPLSGITTYMTGKSDWQEQFWRDFPRSISPYTQTPLHGKIRMRIGKEFLKGYVNKEPGTYEIGPDEHLMGYYG